MNYKDMPNWNRFVQETLQRCKPPQAAERKEPTTDGGVTNGEQKNTQIQSKGI